MFNVNRFLDRYPINCTLAKFLLSVSMPSVTPIIRTYIRNENKHNKLIVEFEKQAECTIKSSIRANLNPDCIKTLDLRIHKHCHIIPPPYPSKSELTNRPNRSRLKSKARSTTYESHSMDPSHSDLPFRREEMYTE